MAPQTLLQFLQTSTVVDCDTMDFEGRTPSTILKECANKTAVAKSLGPFVDCTSNQVRTHQGKHFKKEMILTASKRRQLHFSSFPNPTM
jgi:hypothetical protein